MSSPASEAPPSRYRVRRVLTALAAQYPDTRSALIFNTPWQLLVATILSAQCTDRRVNLITARLFAECPDAESLARLTEAEIAERIRECGLFRTKARNLAHTARAVLDRWGGTLPADITAEALMSLPGVGRKTANVVLANAFGAEALAVDTHVFRVAHRLGWSHARDPLHTERDLTALIPRRQWAAAHHWLIGHGRAVCHARRPACERCVVATWCPSRRDGEVRRPAERQGGRDREGVGRRGRSHVSEPDRADSEAGRAVRMGASRSSRGGAH